MPVTTSPRRAAQRRTITPAFKKRMMRDAAVFFVALGFVLLLLLRALDGKQFALAALVLIPVATLTFNLFERRAYAATLGGKR